MIHNPFGNFKDSGSRNRKRMKLRMGIMLHQVLLLIEVFCLEIRHDRMKNFIITEYTMCDLTM